MSWHARATLRVCAEQEEVQDCLPQTNTAAWALEAAHCAAKVGHPKA